MSHDVTLSSFLKDVRNHEMTIISDDGDVCRHIQFKRPSTSNYYFNVTTWNGYLCISGDMGTYVFSRLYDMFQFFRDDTMRVNYGYWGEKLSLISRHAGHLEFDRELVKQFFTDRVNDICNDIDDLFELASDDERAKYSTPDAMAVAFRAGVEDRLKWADLGEWRFVSEIESFELNIAECLNLTDDFDWVVSERLSYHFKWCCYAIVWAIKQYDRSKNPIVIPSYYQPVLAPTSSERLDGAL